MYSLPASNRTPSIIILNPTSQALVDNANVRIAPWMMGAFADLFLQGIITVQMSNYLINASIDSSSRRFVWLVLLVGGLCLLKSAQNMNIVWEIFITNFANPDVVVTISWTYWGDYTTGLMTAIIAIVVQSFFVYRYWMLTRRLIICGVILCGMLLSLAAASFVVVYLPQRDFPRANTWSLVHFVSAVSADALITSLTVYHLYRQKAVVRYTTGVPHSYDTDNSLTTMELQTVQTTTNMINRLIWMIWQSALPPTVCVIINAALVSALPSEMIHRAFNMILPKLYAISLMYTLNLRNKMRGERYAVEEVSRHTIGYDLDFSMNQALSAWNNSDVPNGPNTITRSGGERSVRAGGQGHLRQRSNGERNVTNHLDTSVSKIGGNLDDLQSRRMQSIMGSKMEGDESDASSSERKATDVERLP